MLKSVTWSGTIAGSVERTYDGSLRLEQLTVNGSDPIAYTYDDDSLLLSAGPVQIVREPDTGRIDTVTVGQVTTNWTYTDFGEPHVLTTRFGTAPLYEEQFTYDKRGWITSLARTQGGSTVTESFDGGFCALGDGTARKAEGLQSWVRVQKEGANRGGPYDPLTGLVRYPSEGNESSSRPQAWRFF